MTQYGTWIRSHDNFFFSSRRRHTRSTRDWSSDVCSSDLIERAIADFAARAQANQLKVDELQGGTFTISNGGVYGSMLSTPIVNPPQSGVLGLHVIEDRPVARDRKSVV